MSLILPSFLEAFSIILPICDVCFIHCFVMLPLFSLARWSFSKIVFPALFIKVLHVYCRKLRKYRKQKREGGNSHLYSHHPLKNSPVDWHFIFLSVFLTLLTFELKFLKFKHNTSNILYFHSAFIFQRGSLHLLFIFITHLWNRKAKY